MKKKIIYFACHYSSTNHRWYSSGGNTKVLQTINLLKKISFDFIFVNFTPQESSKIIPTTINICSSFNIFIYSLEILFSFFSIKKFISEEDKLVILVYNPRFTSLLFYISSIFLLKHISLIIQVEDIPGARKRNFNLLDKISFKILSIFAKHIFFAGEGMLRKFKEKNPNYSKVSLYPPHLTTEFVDKINKRRLPFEGKYINVMYAGGYSEEKGIYDLIQAFKQLKLRNYRLNIYGYFPENITRIYLKNKSIIFHGFVSKKELINSYSNCDIIVNPHKLIANNNYIFPYKNIEIFSSRAFPIVSEFSICGLKLLGIRDLCTYKDLNELKELLKKAPLIWHKNLKKFEDSSNQFLEIYSENKVLNHLKDIIEKL